MKKLISASAIMKFTLVLLFYTSHYSLAQNLYFKRFVAPGGISMGLVRGLTQDKHGYIWIGGTGVFRYDGYQIKTFKNDPLDSNSLGSNTIESIYAGKNGIIWIGTKGYGLDRFDPSNGTFTHFRRPELIHNKVTALFEDRDGVLWVGTHGGLDRFDAATGKFFHYTNVPGDLSSLSCNQVRTIYEDHHGTLWIGTGSPFTNDDSGPNDGGLNRMDKKTGKFTRYMHVAKDPHSLINNKVGSIFEDSRGTFWIGTAGDGLHTMDRSKGIFTRHRYDPLHPEKLSRPPTAGPWDHIRFITEDAAGQILIGSWAAGMNRYDPVRKNMTMYFAGRNRSGFTDSTAWSTIISHEGVLWVSTFNSNLFFADPLQSNLPYFPMGVNVTSFCEDDKGLIWMGTSSGFLRPNQPASIETSFSTGKSDFVRLNNVDIRTVYRDRFGTTWMGITNQISCYNQKANSFSHFRHDENNSASFSGGSPFVIIEDKQGMLLIGSDNGIDLMDREKNVFINYKKIPGDTNSLSENWATALHEDVKGNLWVGTFNGGGLHLMDRKTGRFKHYLRGASISFLFEDSDSVLWVGTDGGFYSYNRSANRFVQYVDPKATINIGNLSIKGMLEDGKKHLWVSTSVGFMKVNSKRDEITIYGGNRGVNANDLLPFVALPYKSRDGKLYFGDVSGYYSFFPDSIPSNSKPPQIVFEDFRIRAESIKPWVNNALKGSFNETNEIRLNYKQNIFSLDFTAIHYTSPEENMHLFMLEDYDHSWRQSGMEHSAYYYNVPPGRYTFRVRASSSNGVWAEKSVSIIISPPWWRTWWAYCIYGILFIAAAYAIHRIQKQRVVNAERERTRERELEQAREIEKAYQQLKVTQSQLIQQEKMASLGELTAGIAHEIQNPLNFVNNFSDVNSELIDDANHEMEKGNINEAKAILNDIKDNENKIKHHGKRADAIVKGMLQHSRTSSGQKELTDINALCDEYLRLAYHGLRAKDQSFNAIIKTDFDPNIGKVSIISQDIGRVILNLVNNAFYAVSEKQKQNIPGYEPIVTISTKKVNGKIEIGVKDNGNGIPQKVLDKIFQPFFTTKPAGQGTGLGLSLAYDIVKAHGGELKVDTHEGEGSEFIVQLPKI